MKAIAFAIALFGFTGFAQAHNLYCIGHETYGTPASLTVQLQPVAQSVDDVPEETEVPYKLLVKNGDEILATGVVQAQQLDVKFSFDSKQDGPGSIQGYVYMDELNQAGIWLNGPELSLDCSEPLVQ